MRRLLALLLLAGCLPLFATPTENRELRVVPAPGQVTIDGDLGDWDLSGGEFGCDDVENFRDDGSCWVHAMYDGDYLYLLARYRDTDPLDSRQVKAAGYGWNGDCFQVRMTTDRTLHITAWRDANGESVMDIYYGTFSKGGKEGAVPDALAEGAKMAFQKTADNKGYYQEIALPWKLVRKDGKAMKGGDTCRLTWEGRLGKAAKLADLYAPNPDRIFTFRATKSWGRALFVAEGPVEPSTVELADGREFPVTMQHGVPVVNWEGLIVEDKLEGHIELSFALEKDGYVTLALVDTEGRRVRNLVSNRFFTAGEHTVLWDGLADGVGLEPGPVVAPGTYRWHGLVHDNLHLVYRGVYHNAGDPPWSNFQRTSDWGGDHGRPIAACTVGDRVYLGWSGGEASTQLISVNPQSYRKVWGERRGYSSTELLCSDGTELFAGPNRGNTIFRLTAKDGIFQPFPTTETADLPIPPLAEGEEPRRPNGMAVREGKLWLSFTEAGKIAVLDIATATYVAMHDAPAPARLAWAADGSLLFAGADGIHALDVATGQHREVIGGLDEPHGLTVAADGRIVVAEWGKSHQVKVFDADGKLRSTVGKAGGRAPRGPWEPTAFRHPAGLTVGPGGRLWVGEYEDHPRRWTVWDLEPKAPKLVKELFGPSHYGADGGALWPADPYVGVGQGCEWRVDPETGRETCLGVIAHDEQCNVPFPLTDAHSSAYFQVGEQWYLAQGWHRYYSMVKIYKRRAPGDFQLVAVLGNSDDWDPKKKVYVPYAEHPLLKGKRSHLFAWADANGDEQVQEAELSWRDMGQGAPVRKARGNQPAQYNGISGAWQQLGVGPGLECWLPMRDGGIWHFPVNGFTAAGAPRYDLTAAGPLPAMSRPGNGPVMPNMDGSLVATLTNPLMAWPTAGGAASWSYRNDWSGVHGSHRAPQARPGLLRGTFCFIGSAVVQGADRQREEVLMVNSNVGEWHCFTADGLYIANLFTADPSKVKWPAAKPGALMDNVPPGMGGEDFGGSFTGTLDGRAFIQAGKTGYWIVELTGLDSLRRLPGGTVTQAEKDLPKAREAQASRRQALAGIKKMDVHRGTRQIDGDLADWPAAHFVEYDFDRRGTAQVRSALAWDDQRLYLAWHVSQAVGEWQNAAKLPEELFARGDTIDLQICVNPDAKEKRRGAGPHDRRLSIGQLAGEAAAVIYAEQGELAGGRQVILSSGVIRDFPVQVARVEDIVVAVAQKKRTYWVEASVPLSALGLPAKAGLEVEGDLGVTYANRGGVDVVRRAYWSNRNAGIVNDEVFELKLSPQHWGKLRFVE